jgi:hypothetical protein
MATNQYIEMGLLQHTLVIQIFQEKYEEAMNSHRENASSYLGELSSGPIRASRCQQSKADLTSDRETPVHAARWGKKKI